MMRINKYLAQHQYASRRGADTLISEGKVLLNGNVAQLGDNVEDDDVVEVKGMQKGATAYYAYYKPQGVVTMGAQGDERAIEDITTFPERVYALGRLDKESEGLIVFTNDGRLTDALLQPSGGYEKEYEVSVDKVISHSFIQHMAHGVPIGTVGKTKNYITKPALVRRKNKYMFHIVLTEGKNRQIRNMCKALGYEVKKLKRFRVVNIEAEGLTPGGYRKIDGTELQDFLGELGIT